MPATYICQVLYYSVDADLGKADAPQQCMCDAPQGFADR